MKKVGIIGGLSPESTITYYAYLTRNYVAQFGDCSYPEIIIYSVSLEKYHQWRNEGRWDLIINDLVAAGRALERAGVDIGLIATNTMHKVFDEVQRQLKIPFISIIDETVKEIKKSKIGVVGLLGTRFTMSDRFFADALESNGINVVAPNGSEQAAIHRIIEEELVKNVINESSRAEYIQIIHGLIKKGAKGVILGCTEIPLLVRPGDVPVVLFDTAQIHAKAMFNAMLSETSATI